MPSEARLGGAFSRHNYITQRRILIVLADRHTQVAPTLTRRCMAIPEFELRELQTLLSDRYRVEREIARGGMATVFLAHDLRHDRKVALKVMHPEVAVAMGHERFLREIKLAAKLSHPNILTVHDSGESGGYLWYTMPYVDGQTLRQKMLKEGRVQVYDVLRLMHEAAEAIGYAHSLGIVHRDIKPENILLSRGHAMIADFGIARAMDAARDDNLTSSGVALGTTAYMSPEQALGENIDAATDVWALGCVMYEMLAGNPPFGTGGREVVTRSLVGKRDPLPKVRPPIRPEVAAIVDKALANDKHDRLANATELAEAIETIPNSSKAVIVARSVGPDTAHRTRYIGSIAIVLAVIAVAVATMWNGRSQRVESPTIRRATLSSDSIAREFYRQAQAQAARRTGDGWAQAIDLYSRAIQRDSSFALAWANLARTVTFASARASGVPGFSDDSLVAIARRASEKAIVLAPDDPVTWVVKSRVSRMMDPTDNLPRLFQLRKAIALDSTYAAAWFELGLVTEEQLDDSAALAAFARAAQLDPSNTEVLSFLGLHYVWTGEYEKGMKWGDSAVNLDPTYALARDATGQLALELGRLSESQRQFEIQARLNKGREVGNSYAMLARVYALEGNVGRAHDYLNRAYQIIDSVRPNRHEAAWMATALAAMHDTLGAVHFMQKYEPREDMHFQLHLKRDPGLRWIKGSRWEKDLLIPDPLRR